MFCLQKHSWIQSNEFGFLFFCWWYLSNEECSRKQKSGIGKHTLIIIPPETEFILEMLRGSQDSLTSTCRPSFSGPCLLPVSVEIIVVSSYGWLCFTVGKTLQHVKVSQLSWTGKPANLDFTNSLIHPLPRTPRMIVSKTVNTWDSRTIEHKL